MCCGYTFELHRLVDAIQMSFQNLCFYEEKSEKKNIAYTPLNKLFADLVFKGWRIWRPFELYAFPLKLKIECSNILYYH